MTWAAGFWRRLARAPEAVAGRPVGRRPEEAQEPSWAAVMRTLCSSASAPLRLFPSMMQTGGPLAVHAACTCASSALGVCSAPASVLAASSRASDLVDGRDMRSDGEGNHGTVAATLLFIRLNRRNPSVKCTRGLRRLVAPRAEERSGWRAGRGAGRWAPGVRGRGRGRGRVRVRTGLRLRVRANPNPNLT